MSSYETSITIAAPPEAVWRILSDVVRWPEWMPTVTRVEPRGSTTLAPSAQFFVVQPKLRPVIWVVTRLEPLHGFTWESRGPGYRVVADHRIEQVAPGQTSVVLQVMFTGLLGALLGQLTGNVTQEYIAREAAALKQTVEGA